MAYTAFAEMKAYNEKRFNQICGPIQPVLYNNGIGNDLKTAALRFIRSRCEGLRFCGRSVAEEMDSGSLSGTGLKEKQIPYNMQMDNDRLCMEKALECFMDSGTADDAYAVYYCYLEMFIGSYGKSKTMIELLSEFENNGSALLMKHRDHYSHSVYVFALGLAIYDTNALYRKAFSDFYGINDENKAAHVYLEFWGLTSLFHDIGYPFELPFEQAMSYFEVANTDRGPGVPYLAYHSLENYTSLSENAQKHFNSLYSREFTSCTELLAFDIAEKLGSRYDFTEDYIRTKIDGKPVHPEDFNYYMDHAYFSAVRLYRELADTIGADCINKIHVDSLSAILLHNSLFKFAIINFKSKPPKYKGPLDVNLHPLAFMLMLCDELQCWDRTAYGRTSRSILYPMAVDFDFSDGCIHAIYRYNSDQEYKIRVYEKQKAEYDSGLTEKKPRLKTYSDMTGKNDFAEEIKQIVDLSEIPFTAVPDTCPEDRSKKHTFLSSSSFLHLYDFAVLLSARRKINSDTEIEDRDKFNAEFDKLSLEYKIQHLNRARNFSIYLNAVGCFYTDKPVDFDLLSEFTSGQTDIIAPMEHERWLRSHYETGWVYGNQYETCNIPECKNEEEERQKLREQLRCHKSMIDGEITSESAYAHYKGLPEEEQDKDIEPMNWMLRFVRMLDGVKIYTLY